MFSSFSRAGRSARLRHSTSLTASRKGGKGTDLPVYSKKACGWIALALAGVLFFTLQARAQDKIANSPAKKTSSVKKENPKPTAKREVSSRSRKRSRRISYRYRLARLRLEPQRVQEIQQALIQAGYLKQEPTGRWDEPTRDAMRRYQADHGFPTTGLPEAKSLMKLGLGPHPLPEDCAPAAQARASTDTLVQPEGTPRQSPSSSQSPQQDK
jgi:peptidoglycan hydrolase-like protein with peptidoglycan-binding domain